jgi:hypothetical protein
LPLGPGAPTLLSSENRTDAVRSAVTAEIDPRLICNPNFAHSNILIQQRRLKSARGISYAPGGK